MDYRSVRIQDIINSGNIQNSLNRIIEMNDNRKDLKMLDDRTVITPDFIVTDMINLVRNHNKNIFNPKSRFLIINPKNGEFIVQIFQNLMKSEDMIKFEKDETKRAWYILKNQIYILCTDKTIAIMLGTLLYGDSGLASKHITWTISNKDLDKLNENQLKGYVLKRFKETAESIEHKEQETYMKFDVVIGNPPYNNDVYLDFVTLGHKLIKEDGIECMITPAKHYFLRNTANCNKMNKEILEYTEKLIFYQCEGEVFGISLPSGVGCYLIGKEKSNKILVKNESNYFESFKHDWKELNVNEETFNIKAIGIVNKIHSIDKLNFNIESMKLDKKYKVFARKNCYAQGGSSNKSRGIFYYDDNFVQGFVTVAVVRSSENTDNTGIAKCIASFDTEDERESFISYIDTKFVRYLLNARVSAYSNMYINEVWRFVPDPGVFDHIFTDAELYKKYNLTEEEINIIESVIKERK